MLVELLLGLDLVSWSALEGLTNTSSLPNTNMGKRVEQSENIQEPQNHGDYYDAIQNRFDGSLHWNKAIYQPQENTHHDENF
jgi:hypothetical protein